MKNSELTRDLSYAYLSRAEIGSVDDEKRTIDLVYSQGLERTLPWWANPLDSYDPIRERLEISEQSVDPTRLDSGAPFLTDHWGSIANQHGVVERSWVEDGKAYATVRFSKNEKTNDLWNDIRDGIVRGISFGYRILEYKIEEASERGDLDTLVITRFQPTEISAVAIPADTTADFLRSLPTFKDINKDKKPALRSEPMSGKANQNKDGQNVEDPKTPNAPTPTEPTRSADPEPKPSEPKEPTIDLAAQERARASEILSLCRSLKVDAEKEQKFIEDGTSVEAVRKELLEMQIQRTNSNKPTTSHVTGGQTDGQKRELAVENALLNRCMPKTVKLEENNHFRSMTLHEIAKDCLRSQGESVDFLDRHEVIKKALYGTRSGAHSTSDFPKILANVNNKIMLMNYEQKTAYQTFQPLVSDYTVNDFKESTLLRIGENPDFEESIEGEELKYGTISEDSEKISVRKFRKGLAITEEMLINDDINAFRQVGNFAAAAARLESELVYDVLLSNPLMGDNINLFASQHGNLAGSGSVVNESSLNAATNAIVLQKGLDSKRPLRLRAKYLVHGVGRRLEVMKQLAQIAPETSANVNVFAGMFTPIEEPLLDADSNPWFLLADPMQGVELIALIGLAGRTAPQIEQKVDFDTDCILIKAKHYKAAKAIDYRGMFKNPGA